MSRRIRLNVPITPLQVGVGWLRQLTNDLELWTLGSAEECAQPRVEDANGVAIKEGGLESSQRGGRRTKETRRAGFNHVCLCISNLIYIPFKLDHPKTCLV